MRPGSCSTARSHAESDFATVLRHVRVISSSMARVAAVLAEYYGDEVRDLRAQGVDDETIGVVDRGRLRRRRARVAPRVRRPAPAPRRAVAPARVATRLPDLAVAVGFADLAGYTRAQRRARSRPPRRVRRRGGRSSRTTPSREHGGRVVKTIGDEVMFAGLSAQVARIAIALRDAAGAQDLPPVRSGIAAGMVVARDGDFYGPVVNLASRLTEIAPAGAIYASDDAARRACRPTPSFAWSAPARPATCAASARSRCSPCSAVSGTRA